MIDVPEDDTIHKEVEDIKKDPKLERIFTKRAREFVNTPQKKDADDEIKLVLDALDGEINGQIKGRHYSPNTGEFGIHMKKFMEELKVKGMTVHSAHTTADGLFNGVIVRTPDNSFKWEAFPYHAGVGGRRGTRKVRVPDRATAGLGTGTSGGSAVRAAAVSQAKVSMFPTLPNFPYATHQPLNIYSYLLD
eukprot:jgi/Mesvir1/27891/Mv26271-RA.1